MGTTWTRWMVHCTALKHYRCYTVYIGKKRSERVVETVGFTHRVSITISIIQGIGNSGIQTINAHLTQSETGRTILSGRRRTNACSPTIGSDL
jgi:hypothetical protein